MGCFSVTCCLSHLPIDYGHEVLFFALARNPFRKTGFICTIDDVWEPLCPPIEAKYNDYGTIEDLAEDEATTAFFETLKSRVIEREVGENPYHDVAVTKDMSREDWLSALWFGRVMVTDTKSTFMVKDPPPLQVAQAMVRKDVWDYLLDFGKRSFAENVRPLVGEDLPSDLTTVAFAMHRLRITWFEGTTTGPQHGEWEDHRRFHQTLVEIADREIARYEE